MNRYDAIRAALFAHDGMETLIREDGLPREAVEPEPLGFLDALEGVGYTVLSLEAVLILDAAWAGAEGAMPEYWHIRSLIEVSDGWEVVAAEGNRVRTARGHTPAAALINLAAMFRA